MGIATEGNPLILWAMNKFEWSLDTVMIVRIFFYIPFIYILNKWDWSRFAVLCYIALYILLTGIQF